jgi:transcriptional regulator with XRE-family HTH domain
MSNLKVALQAYRARHNLTQKEVAEKCGWNPYCISMIERGFRPITAKTLKRLEPAYDLNELHKFIVDVMDADVVKDFRVLLNHIKNGTDIKVAQARPKRKSKITLQPLPKPKPAFNLTDLFQGMAGKRISIVIEDMA